MNDNQRAVALTATALASPRNRLSGLAALCAAVAVSGCLSSPDGGSPKAPSSSPDAPILFNGMQYSLADGARAHRILEVAGKLYATDGTDVLVSANHGQSWTKLPKVPGEELFEAYEHPEWETYLVALFKVGNSLYVKPEHGDSVYRLDGGVWRGVIAVDGPPGSQDPFYSFSAAGKDYVCGLSWPYVSYGNCSSVAYDGDSLKFSPLHHNSDQDMLRAHFVSGDTLYLLHQESWSSGRIVRVHPISGELIEVLGLPADPEPIVIAATPPSGAKAAADEDGWPPLKLQVGERFAFFDEALFVSEHDRLWRILGDSATLIHYTDDAACLGDSILCGNENGYTVLKRIGPNLLFAGAGREMRYLHAGSEIPVRIPFFDDKGVLDVHVSGGRLIVATREGIYTAVVKR